MADQRIKVEFDALNEPSETAIDLREEPSLANKPSNLRTIATIGLVANAGRQIGMSTLGQVGAITGNAQTQRTINKIGQLGGVVGAFVINPLVGALTLATTLGAELITSKISARNENNAAIYYSKINGRRIDKGRIK